uniref:Odorant receptor n=1 Tax=Conopomorpha sinensis TaxID=940481 RepID=A0A3S7SGS5_9NEOP|nr:putative odorant receptor 23 [Conopomorpha sinensis]
MTQQFRQSESFNNNLLCLTIFGIWSRERWPKTYKFYSFVYLNITLVLFNLLLTWNLFATPRNIESLISEVIFYFTEVAVTAKVLMVFTMKQKIIEAFEILDSEHFSGDTIEQKAFVQTYSRYYKKFWKYYALYSNFTYCSLVVLLIVGNLAFGMQMQLPACKYYFMTDKSREDRFVFLYLYQSLSLYGHMMYNVNVDSMICGFMLYAICQFKLLNMKLGDIKTTREMKSKNDDTEAVFLSRLRNFLVHYDTLLSYCERIQNITCITTFVMFAAAAAIICVVLCGLLILELTAETFLFMVSYLIAMVLQIFVPALLGTLLSYESVNLVTAAYNTEWIPRSESFKRNLNLFVLRANKPVVLIGWKLFPLSLDTFTSIMKTAYSLFTLVRNVQQD